MNPKGAVWISLLVYPFESQWSLLHKFCTWNATNLCRLNKKTGARKSAWYPVNLAVDSFWDNKVFNTLTDIPIEDLEKSLSNYYVPDIWGESLVVRPSDTARVVCWPDITVLCIKSDSL